MQLGIATAYLYIFFTTDLVRQYYIQNQPDYDAVFDAWKEWMWPGFLHVSLPLGICAVAIGIISLIFLRKSYRGSGTAFIIIVGLVHSITFGFWYTKGEIKGTVFLAIAMCICSAIISIPGLLLSGLEK